MMWSDAPEIKKITKFVNSYETATLPISLIEYLLTPI